MAGCRALITQTDHDDLSADRRGAANDKAAVPLGHDIPLLTLPEAAMLAPCPANDDWIEADLPSSIKVLTEEILILDQFLRGPILALFD